MQKSRKFRAYIIVLGYIPGKEEAGDSRDILVNKKELAKELSNECGIPVKEAENILSKLYAIQTGELERGGEVKIAGFGIFKVTTRKAKTARNPLTGEPISVPERKHVLFTPSKTLTDKVRQEND